ncbi:family transcriptional regulator, putative [Babesia ovata]|uniref:Family transcriptional regulator, putative n=1 Tax=Babesia ovata TaxID=189622 RepID=A0A2H6KFM6_9APIC|nr:family transcriptional regulator, putative [Babesia ovata]GBE61784.1 family transcriptional regulator, putative [Babesia ovata]
MFIKFYFAINVHLDFLNRLRNRRNGRSLDLLFGDTVEIANGGGKSADRIGEWLFDVFLKLFGNIIITIIPIHKIPHRIQLTVHGLGGAFVRAGGGGLASRPFKRRVKFISLAKNLI